MGEREREVAPPLEIKLILETIFDEVAFSFPNFLSTHFWPCSSSFKYNNKNKKSR